MQTNQLLVLLLQVNVEEYTDNCIDEGFALDETGEENLFSQEPGFCDVSQIQLKLSSNCNI